MICRLVEQEQLRIGEQHPRQGQARLLPAAEIGRAHRQGHARQVERGEYAFHLSRSRRRRREPGQGRVVFMLKISLLRRARQRLGQSLDFSDQRIGILAVWPDAPARQILGHCLAGVELGALRHIPHPHIGRRPLHRTGIGLILAGEDAQQRRLAAAVRADQANPFAALEAERNGIENDLNAKRF